MKIDCSKRSNIPDLLTLIATMTGIVAFGLVICLALYVDLFIAGFAAGVTVSKWKVWVCEPITQTLNNLLR